MIFMSKGYPGNPWKFEVPQIIVIPEYSVLNSQDIFKVNLLFLQFTQFG